MHFASQQGAQVRCEWGDGGLLALAPAEVVVVVDVLSFCTAVDVATARGATILPLAGKVDPQEFALRHNALLATKARTPVEGGFTLSPASLAQIPAGTRVVLPSPNGSRLCATAQAHTSQTRGAQVIAGSLRNAQAIARWINRRGGSVNLIPAGERWPDGSLRPALEDWIGAGAIISALHLQRSPEAEAAAQLYRWAESRLAAILAGVASAQELAERGFAGDVTLAMELNCSTTVPLLQENGFFNAAVESAANEGETT